MKIAEAIYELPFFLFITKRVFVHNFGHFFGLMGFLRKVAVVNTAPGYANPVDNRRDSQNIPPSRSRRGKSTIASNNSIAESSLPHKLGSIHSGAVTIQMAVINTQYTSTR